MSLLRIENLTIALPPGAERAYAVEDVSLMLDPGRDSVHRRRKRVGKIGVGIGSHGSSAAAVAAGRGPDPVRGSRRAPSQSRRHAGFARRKDRDDLSRTDDGAESAHAHL